MIRFIAVFLLCMASGCFDWSTLFAKKPAAAPAEAAPPPAAVQPAAPEGQAAAAPPKIDQGVPDIEARIVDKHKALAERPHLVETENRITASDPVFAPLQGLRAAGSRAEILAFTHTIEIHKATNDRYPTYDEFMNYYRDAHVQLKGLKPWQVYAYDESTGTVTLMEDPLEKERISKEWEEKNRL